MDRFTLTFALRQNALLTNTFVRIYTSQGDFRAEYVPCSETPVYDQGCTYWKYTFCVQRCDLPGGLEVCNITPDITVAPYLTAIPPINFDDSDTINWSGSGTEADPLVPNLTISENADQAIDVLPDGVFVPISNGGGGGGTNLETWAIALGDEESDIEVANNVVRFPIPFDCEIQEVWIELNEAGTDSTLQADLNYIQDINGSVVGAGSIFTTPITLDSGEISSLTGTPAVLDPAFISRSKGDQMGFDWDAVGATLAGIGGKLVMSLLRL